MGTPIGGGRDRLNYGVDQMVFIASMGGLSQMLTTPPKKEDEWDYLKDTR